MGERTTITTADGTFSAYVARPAKAEAPAIVVIQEIFGVNQVMRDITDGLAAQGYLAICPDLFWRIEPGIDINGTNPKPNGNGYLRALSTPSTWDAGVTDIAATIDHIRGRRRLQRQGGRGGLLPGRRARLSPPPAAPTPTASVSYYGVGLENRVAEAEKLTHPLLMHIAEEDQFVPKPAQAVILAALKDHPQIEIHTYPGCDHAFAREGGEHFNAAAAKLANGRTLTFFQRTLSTGGAG